MSRRTTIIVIGTICLIITLWLMLSHNQVQMINCYEDETEGMTIQEVANLLDVALVELTWLPQDISVLPEVSTWRMTIQGRDACRVRIDYWDASSTITIRLIGVDVGDLSPIPSTRMPSTCSWQFVLDEARTSLSTNCNAEVERASETLDFHIQFSAEFSPDDAQRVINGMRIVDPSG